MARQPASGATSLELRNAMESDAPALGIMRTAFWADQISKGAIDHPDIDAHQLLSDTRALVARSRTKVILATSRGATAGYAVGQTKIVPGAKGFAVGSIEEIYVQTSYRHSGVARRLVERILDEFKTVGVERIQLRALEKNEVAKSFWRELGFSPSVIIYEYSK